MEPTIEKFLQGIPYAGMGTTLERNALIGVIKGLIEQDKFTVDYILNYCESVGYQRQMAEDVFKELTGLSPKLIVNNNEYYNMPAGVPNMCIAWGLHKSKKDFACYVVPWDYGYCVMEKDENNAPVVMVETATIPEAIDELKKVAKNIQTLDKIITSKLLEAEDIQCSADEPNQTQLPYSSSPLKILKKNFKDKVLSGVEFERQARKLLAEDKITVDEAEDLMLFKQDLEEKDKSYANDILQLDEEWKPLEGGLTFEDVFNEVKQLMDADNDILVSEERAKSLFNSNKSLFKGIDLVEAVNRLYQLVLGFSKDEILGHSKFEDKQPKQSAKKVCPNCGSDIIGHPALSRKDNKTEICSECGQLEALEDFYKHFSNKKQCSRKRFFIVDLDTGEKLAGPFNTKEDAENVLQKEFSIDEMGLDSNIMVMPSDELWANNEFPIKAKSNKKHTLSDDPHKDAFIKKMLELFEKNPEKADKLMDSVNKLRETGDNELSEKVEKSIMKKNSSKKITAENMTLDDIEEEDNKDEVQEEIDKINDTPVEELLVEETPIQYFDDAVQEDKVDTINEVVSKCIDKFSEKFADFDKYTVKILSYNTKVLGDYAPNKEEMVEDKEINANAILQIILAINNNADDKTIKKALAVFSITNGKLHWSGTIRGENDQIVAFTEEGIDNLFEVEEVKEDELEDII